MTEHNDMEDKKPLKKTRSRPKKISTEESIKSTESIDSSAESAKTFQKCFRDMFEEITEIHQQKNHKLQKKIISRQKVEDQIQTYLSEYLSGYILIGYNAFTNDRVMIDYASSEQNFDAMRELFKTTFIQMMNGM